MASPSLLSRPPPAGGARGAPAQHSPLDDAAGVPGLHLSAALSTLPKDHSGAPRAPLTCSRSVMKCSPPAGEDRAAKAPAHSPPLPFLHRATTPQASPALASSDAAVAAQNDTYPSPPPSPLLPATPGRACPSQPVRCPPPPTLHLPLASTSTSSPSPTQPSPSPSPSPSAASASCHGPPRHSQQWPVPLVPSLDSLSSAAAQSSPSPSTPEPAPCRSDKGSGSAPRHGDGSCTRMTPSPVWKDEGLSTDAVRPTSSSSLNAVQLDSAPAPLSHHEHSPAATFLPVGDADDESAPSTPAAVEAEEEGASSFHQLPVPRQRRSLRRVSSSRSFFPPSCSTPGKRLPASPVEYQVSWLGSSASTTSPSSRHGRFARGTHPPAPSTPCTPSRANVFCSRDRDGASISERRRRFLGKGEAHSIARVQSSDSTCEPPRLPRTPLSRPHPSCSPAGPIPSPLQPPVPGPGEMEGGDGATVVVGSVAAAAAQGPVAGLLIADAGNGLVVGVTRSLVAALGYADACEMQGRCVPDLADDLAVADWWHACCPVVSASRQSSLCPSSSACAEASSTRVAGSGSGESLVDASLTLRLLKSERKGVLVGRKVRMGVEAFCWEWGITLLLASHQDLVLLQDPAVWQKAAGNAAGSFQSPSRKPGSGRFSGKGLVLACVALASAAPSSVHLPAQDAAASAPPALVSESSASATPTSLQANSEQLSSSAWSRSSAADGALGWSTESGGAFAFSRCQDCVDGEELGAPSPAQGHPDPVPGPGGTPGRLEQLQEQEKGQGGKECMGLDGLEEEQWDRLVWKSEKMEEAASGHSKTATGHFSHQATPEAAIKQQPSQLLKALSLSRASKEAPAGGGVKAAPRPSAIPAFLHHFDEKLRQRGGSPETLGSRMSADVAQEEWRRDWRPPAAASTVQEGCAVPAWHKVQGKAEWEEEGMPVPGRVSSSSSAVLRALPSADKQGGAGCSLETPAGVPDPYKAVPGPMNPGKGPHKKGSGMVAEWRKGGPRLLSWLKTPFSKSAYLNTKPPAQAPVGPAQPRPLQPKGRFGRQARTSLVAFSSPGGLLSPDLPAAAAAAAGDGGGGGGFGPVKPLNEEDFAFHAPSAVAGSRPPSIGTLMRRKSDLKERQAGQIGGRFGPLQAPAVPGGGKERLSLEVSRKEGGSVQERGKYGQRLSSLRPNPGYLSDRRGKDNLVDEDAWGKPMRANWGEGEEEADGEMAWFW